MKIAKHHTATLSLLCLLIIGGSSCTTFKKPQRDLLAGPWDVDAVANRSLPWCCCPVPPAHHHDETIVQVHLVVMTASNYIIADNSLFLKPDQTQRVEFPMEAYYFGPASGHKSVADRVARQNGFVLVSVTEINGVFYPELSGEIRVDGNIVWKMDTTNSIQNSE